MAGIIGYGTYIPKNRLKLEDIASVWKKNPDDIISALKVHEKTVPSFDEDSVTLGIESSVVALKMAGIEAKDLQSVFVGSESHPYAVNPTSTIIADILGVGNDYFAVDLEFACKAATAGCQVTLGLIESKRVKYGMVVGADTAQAKPHDVLEYTAASAATSYIFGNDEKDIIARVLETSSFSSDTPDFWRRDGQRYPSHFGRFTGEPAYFSHVLGEARSLLEKTNTKPSDYKYCVFHMPNGKFPRVVSKKLGFTKEQLEPSLTVDKIGNPYSASALFGLARVLDIAKPGEKIFFVSYGSGAGADGFIFETTEHLLKKRNLGVSVDSQIENKKYVSYLEYLRQTHKL